MIKLVVMDLPEPIINNIYSYLPAYLRADLKCKLSVKLDIKQYENLNEKLGVEFWIRSLRLNPEPRIRLNFNHPIRELIWGFRS